MQWGGRENLWLERWVKKSIVLGGLGGKGVSNKHGHAPKQKHWKMLCVDLLEQLGPFIGIRSCLPDWCPKVPGDTSLRKRYYCGLIEAWGNIISKLEETRHDFGVSTLIRRYMWWHQLKVNLCERIYGHGKGGRVKGKWKITLGIRNLL